MDANVADFRALVPQGWGWDLIYFGALAALSWGALATALFVRRLSVAVLALLCVDVLIFGLAVRGYLWFVWPPLGVWVLTYVNVFGHIGLALYILTFFFLARQEGIALPGGTRLAWLAGLQGGAAAIILVAPGFSRVASPLLNLGTAAILLAIAVVMTRRKVPAARLMFLTMLLLSFRMGVSACERLSRGLSLPHPDYLIMHSPLVSMVGLVLNLTLIAAWVAYVSKQRRAASLALALWQTQEKSRLESEVARQTLALHQALQYADEANRKKTEGLGYISHDLRAPLSSIAGYAELLARTQTPIQQPYIQSIMQSVSYQLALIDDLLEYTRTEMEPFVLHPAPLSLPELVDAVVRHARVFCARQNNRFQYASPTRLPTGVLADGRRLQQVLLNLLVNASKFTRNGTITLTVSAKSSGSDWLLHFSVVDTGIGMTPDMQTRVFSAYAQVHPQLGGVGLGLYIARHIVQAMGGELNLSSNPGAGSCFSFAITVAEASASSVRSLLDTGLPQGWVRPVAANQPFDGQPLPPPHTRVELAILARDGQLTKIEEWAAATEQDYPGYEVFFAEIRAALQTLDFEYIEALALSVDPTAPEESGALPSDGAGRLQASMD